MNSIGSSILQRPAIDESNFKANQKADLGNLLNGLTGQLSPEAGGKKDKVSISEEGRKASASFQSEAANKQKKDPGSLKKPEEEKTGQAAEEDKKKAEGPQGAGGQGGSKPDSARDNLEKRLEALQKQQAKLKEEINELKRAAANDEAAASELQAKEAEEQMLKAQMKLLSQQLQNLEGGQDKGGKGGGQDGPAA